ncbi:glycosyltransferase family 4 protein [Kutzneria kofuensis]
MTPEWFEDEPGGGIGTYCRVTAAAVAALGHRVTVFAATARDGRAADAGVRPVVCDPADAFGCAQAFRDAWLDLPAADRPDVIEAADYCGVAALVAESPGAPPVTTRLHLPLELLIRRNGGGRIYRDDQRRMDLERRQVRHSAQLTSPSRWLAREAVALWDLPEPPVVIPNPVAADWLVPAPAARRDGPPRLLYFGRMEHRKGVLTLAEAVARHFAAPAELTFAGGDTRWQGRSVTDLVRDRLQDRPAGVDCRFLPAQPPAAMRAEIDRCDLVVLPSRYENFPYTCLEAMARGKPVLATAGSGFDDIVRPGRTGWLVPPDDPDALADALAACLADPERLALAGREARRDVARLVAGQVVPTLVARYRMVVKEPVG